MFVLANLVFEIVDAILQFFDGAQLVMVGSCYQIILGIELLEFRVGVEDVTLQLTDHEIIVVLEGEVAAAVTLLKIRELAVLDVRGMTSEVVNHRPLIVQLNEVEDEGTGVRDTHENEFTLCDQAELGVEVSDGT